MASEIDTSAKAVGQAVYQLRYLPAKGLIEDGTRRDFASLMAALAAQRDAAQAAPAPEDAA